MDGDKVTVRLRLKRNGADVVPPLSVEGSKSDLPGLTEKIAQAILGATK